MTSNGEREQDCERCWKLADRQAGGTPLGEEDAAMLRDHVRSCPDCAADALFAEWLVQPQSDGVPAPMTSSERERWVEEVLRRKEAAELSSTISRRPRARRSIWIAAAVLAVAAVVTVTIVFVGRSAPRSAPPPAPQVAGATLFLVSGVVEVEHAGVRAGAVLGTGRELRVGTGRVGLALCGDATFFLDAASQALLVEAGPARCRMRLDAGRLVADARRLALGARLVVSTTAGDVRVTGTIFAVEVVNADVEVRVLEGAVEILVPGQAPRTLQQSQAMLLRAGTTRPLTGADDERDRRLAGLVSPSNRPLVPEGKVAATAPRSPLTDPSPPPTATLLASNSTNVEAEVAVGNSPPAIVVHPSLTDEQTADAPALAAAEVPAESETPPTAAALLEAARGLRAAGDWAGSAAAYEQVTVRFPDSSEAHVALVPLGQLRLERLGDVAGALSAFDGYLAAPSSGALVEEASWGRIQALRRLGRSADEAGSVRAFLAEHPASLRADEARRRLTELEAAP